MNTATYRGMARNAELKADFAAAAKWWKLAIDKYPTKTGNLARLDIAKMTARMIAAEKTAFNAPQASKATTA